MLLTSASMCMAAEHKSILISVDELHQLLGKDATSKPILLEVAWGGPENIYNKGHILGAIHINTDEIEYDIFKPRATTAPADLGRSTTADQDLEKALHPEYLVDIAFVRNAINTGNKDFILGNIRGEKEYTGESAPYPYIPTRGRVKGALWGKAGNTPWDITNYVNEDGSYKKPVDIAKMWAEHGITGDKHVAFYCGTTWRSSLAFLYAYELGWPKVSNFDSSWYDITFSKIPTASAPHYLHNSHLLLQNKNQQLGKENHTNQSNRINCCIG